MLYIISRWDHAYTTRAARRNCAGFKLLSYDRVFDKKRLPGGSYIFADLDRLSLHETQLAAIIYRRLKEAGLTVYNDPACALMRFDLLRRLHREGINKFNVYRPQFGEWPERYPVFLRQNAFHLGVLSGLLEDKPALEAGLKELLTQGVPYANTMAVEYAAEPRDEGVFRKLSVYRIGDHYFRDTSVNQRNWVVKDGDIGAADDAFYKSELEAMDEVPFAEEVKRVFEIAKIEYGRVDIGFFEGQPQFYEINTNPIVGFAAEHPCEFRRQSRRRFIENYSAAIASLASIPDGEPIEIKDPIFRKRGRSWRWFFRLYSRPCF